MGSMEMEMTPRKVDIRLSGKGNSNSHGARPVHQKHLRHDEVDPDKLVVNKENAISFLYGCLDSAGCIINEKHHAGGMCDPWGVPDVVVSVISMLLIIVSPPRLRCVPLSFALFLSISISLSLAHSLSRSSLAPPLYEGNRERRRGGLRHLQREFFY